MKFGGYYQTLLVGQYWGTKSECYLRRYILKTLEGLEGIVVRSGSLEGIMLQGFELTLASRMKILIFFFLLYSLGKLPVPVSIHLRRGLPKNVFRIPCGWYLTAERGYWSFGMRLICCSHLFLYLSILCPNMVSALPKSCRIFSLLM